MAREMTEDEYRRFVLEGTRTGKLATWSSCAPTRSTSRSRSTSGEAR